MGMDMNTTTTDPPFACLPLIVSSIFFHFWHSKSDLYLLWGNIHTCQKVWMTLSCFVMTVKSMLSCEAALSAPYLNHAYTWRMSFH